MVVCKFFQQGNCRYGQSCRFDHIYGSKYSYHANAPPPAHTTPAGVTDDQLVNQVLLDVQAALKGGQWILSCYSPYKEKPNFPGIPDLSMEEARLFIYEAKANNNLDQAVAYMNNLFKESTQKYEQLLQATPTILKVLRSLYKGEIVPSPFSNNTQSSGFGSGSAATSIFRSAVQGSSVFGQTPSNNTPSIFSQNSASTAPSVFGQPASNTSVFNQASVFGQASPENAKSIFAQASQNVFGPSQSSNVFGPSSPDTTAKSIFAQATQNAFSGSQPSNAASVFGEANQNAFGGAQPANPGSVFGEANSMFGDVKSGFGDAKSVFGDAKSGFGDAKSVFGEAAQSVFGGATQSVFGQTSSPFGQQQESSSNIYSDVNNLTPEQMEAFKADDFKLGFIPEVPPPYSLCF